MNVKYDWFQTPKNIVINILIKNPSPNDVNLNIEEQQIFFEIKKESRTLIIQLYSKILPSDSTISYHPSKIEIRLVKLEHSDVLWPALEKNNLLSTSKLVNTYPSSHIKGSKNWDKIEKDIEKEEENTKLEGEAALQQLFQKIYADGSDEVKKAMNKSFMESGSTVLSTNWAEVSNKKVDIKAPDGMEWKPYS